MLKNKKELKAPKVEKTKKEQEAEHLRQARERTQAWIDALHDEHGTQLENEAEIHRQEILKKNYQSNLKNKEKELAELEKQIKIKEKKQTNVGELSVSTAAKERKISEMKERLKLNAQEERVSELRHERAQVQDILEAEPSPSDEEAANARLAAIDEELARLETQLEESEAAMPLHERIKEIFKENGVTLTDVRNMVSFDRFPAFITEI